MMRLTAVPRLAIVAFLAALAPLAAPRPAGADLVPMVFEFVCTERGSVHGFEAGTIYEPPPYVGRMRIETLVDTDEQYNYIDANVGSKVYFFDFDDPDHVFWSLPNAGTPYEGWLRLYDGDNGPYYELEVRIGGPETSRGPEYDTTYWNTQHFPAAGFFTGPTFGTPKGTISEELLMTVGNIAGGNYPLAYVTAFPAPEPASLALLTLGAGLLALRRRA